MSSSDLLKSSLWLKMSYSAHQAGVAFPHCLYSQGPIDAKLECARDVVMPDISQ